MAAAEAFIASASRLPQQGMTAGALEPCFGHEQIEGKAGEVIHQRLNVPVVFLVTDFPVSLAVIAGLGAQGRRATLDGMIVNALSALAVTAFDTHKMPLGGAKGAMEVPVALVRLLRTDNARDGLCPADRADSGDIHAADVLADLVIVQGG